MRLSEFFLVTDLRNILYRGNSIPTHNFQINSLSFLCQISILLRNLVSVKSEDSDSSTVEPNGHFRMMIFLLGINRKPHKKKDCLTVSVELKIGYQSSLRDFPGRMPPQKFFNPARLRINVQVFLCIFRHDEQYASARTVSFP